MSDTTKPIRIDSAIHRKLKVYAAKAGLPVVDIVGQSVTNFMREFSAEFLRDNCNQKSKPTKK